MEFFRTITTLHEVADYRIRRTVWHIRDSFENGEITSMQWIAGVQKISDALKKRNPVMFRKLNKVMKEGRVEFEMLRNFKRAKFDKEKKY